MRGETENRLAQLRDLACCLSSGEPEGLWTGGWYQHASLRPHTGRLSSQTPDSADRAALEDLLPRDTITAKLATGDPGVLS